MNTGTFFQPLLLTVAAELRQVAVVQPGDRVMIALSLQIANAAFVAIAIAAIRCAHAPEPSAS